MEKHTAILVNQSAGYLTVDICNAFAKKYDRVILLAGNVSTIGRPLSEKVTVVPLTRYDKSSILSRLRTWKKATRQINEYLDNFEGEADIVYFSNPPMSSLKADRRPGRYALVEYDIYPDVLRNVLCPNFIIRRWARRKREIFAKATGIVTLGNSMREQLGQYIDEDKVTVIHNWSGHEGEIVRVPDAENEFAQAMGLDGKFVAMYSGNIGLTHNVEALLDAASLLRDDDDIRFLIIGTGGRKEELMHIASKRGLHNVTFHNFLPTDKIKYSFSCADLGVVTLNEHTVRSSVPSKTYNLLAYGIPLLNISPEGSELGALTESFGCGASFKGEDTEGIAEFIKHCKDNPEEFARLRANARTASAEFTPANARLYAEIFNI